MEKSKRTPEILGVSLGGMWLGFLISDVALYGRLCAHGVPQDAGTLFAHAADSGGFDLDGRVWIRAPRVRQRQKIKLYFI